MMNFWIGAGAAASVIVAIIVVLQYTRSRSSLLVEVFQHPFEFPTPIADAFVDLDRLISSQGIEGVPDDAVKLRAKEMLRLLGPLYSRRSILIQTFWSLKLRNRGHERVDGVELNVPGAIQIAAKRADSDEAVSKDRITVGDVRPGETVEVFAWGRSIYGSPTVIQSKGRAVIRVHGMLGPRWIAASNYWRYGKFPIIVVLLGVLAIVTVLVSREVHRGQATAHPTDSSAVSK